jgi:hypothetical protein
LFLFIVRAETEKVELLSTLRLHKQCKKMHKSPTAAHEYIAVAHARKMFWRKMSLRAQNSALWKTGLIALFVKFLS